MCYKQNSLEDWEWVHKLQHHNRGINNDCCSNIFLKRAVWYTVGCENWSEILPKPRDHHHHHSIWDYKDTSPLFMINSYVTLWVSTMILRWNNAEWIMERTNSFILVFFRLSFHSLGWYLSTIHDCCRFTWVAKSQRNPWVVFYNVLCCLSQCTVLTRSPGIDVSEARLWSVGVVLK